jgi:DNA-binding winged helix-turn-helix (wHTH) protein
MTAQTQVFGEFRFVRSARELWRGAKRVEMPRRTFECLDYLIANRERAVGRDELVAAIFGRPDVSDAQLGQIVLRTRRAVGDDGNAQHAIRTIPGFGYRWVAELRPEDEASATPECDSERTVPSARFVAPAVTLPSNDLRRSDPRGSDSHRNASRDADTFEAGSRLAVPRADSTLQPDSRRWPRAIAIAALVLVLAILAGAAALRYRGDATPSNASAANDSLVVLPIEVDGLREDGWVRLGAMDLVADRLREAGMRVPPSENVLTMLRGAADVSARPMRAARERSPERASPFTARRRATRAAGPCASRQRPPTASKCRSSSPIGIPSARRAARPISCSPRSATRCRPKPNARPLSTRRCNARAPRCSRTSSTPRARFSPLRPILRARRPSSTIVSRWSISAKAVSIAPTRR